MTALKFLRSQTKAGVSACKDALDQCNGDVDRACEILLKSSGKQRETSKVISEGLIHASSINGIAVCLEVSTETDFVARGASTIAFAEQCGATFLSILEKEMVPSRDAIVTTTTTSMGSYPMPSRPLAVDLIERVLGNHADTLTALRRATGEKVDLRRATAVVGPHTGVYIHRPTGVARVAAIVSSTHPLDEINRKAAVHIASLGLEGCLSAPFGIHGSSKSLLEVFQQEGHQLLEFNRFEVGEGIEKPTENFEEEVRKQVERAATASSQKQ